MCRAPCAFQGKQWKQIGDGVLKFMCVRERFGYKLGVNVWGRLLSDFSDCRSNSVTRSQRGTLQPSLRSTCENKQPICSMRQSRGEGGSSC